MIKYKNSCFFPDLISSSAHQGLLQLVTTVAAVVAAAVSAAVVAAVAAVAAEMRLRKNV